MSFCSQFFGRTDAKGRQYKAPLLVAIGGVVGDSTKPQMIDVDAKWIISAGAIVTHKNALRYRPSLRQPSKSLGADFVSLMAKDAVPFDDGAYPDPASIRRGRAVVRQLCLKRPVPRNILVSHLRALQRQQVVRAGARAPTRPGSPLYHTIRE